jgi:hypothetical protein
MRLRPGRPLAAAAVAAASVTALGVATASAAPAATTRSVAASAHVKNPLGHASTSLTEAAGGARTASTRMAAAYGGYPLRVSTLTTKVLAPLQLSVSKKYGVLVGDAGANKLLQVVRHGNVRVVAKGPQPAGEISGVAVGRDGSIAYTSTNYTTGQTGLTIRSHGKSRFVDLSAFEKKYNPDQRNHYGTTSTDQCVLNFFNQPDSPPASYTGVVDSHPYSVAAVRGGWVVAEAAGNDILFVDAKGHIKVLAVLPPQPHVITAADVQALGAGTPSCLVGVNYKFEPVPTDVEVGRNGALYITTLPGGPEAPGFSARGSVYRLSGHHLRRLATGFDGATNLAITTSGRILVSEIFAGRISTIEHGKPAPVLDLPGVASVEFYRHAVYAGVNGPTDANGAPSGPGKVVKISVRW